PGCSFVVGVSGRGDGESWVSWRGAKNWGRWASLKALDEGYSSKNYVRKFLRALHPKWRAKMIIKKDSKIVKVKGEMKSLALKAKKESSNEESLTSGSEDEEYAMVVKDFKKFFKRSGRYDDPNHLIGEGLKPPKDKNQRAFVRGSLSDSGEKDDKKTKDETCLVAQASSKIRSKSSYFSDENSSTNDTILDKSFNVTFDETHPPYKTSPLVDDDFNEEEAINITEEKNLKNDIEDETLEINEIVSIKESKNHSLENVIGNLNQRIVSSQA
nr:alpha/beta hydrolases superfamily protein [Tanacetum cinerariifolium]